MGKKRDDLLEEIGAEIAEAGIDTRAALGMASELAMGATTAEEAVHIIRSVFCLLTRGQTLEELSGE